MLSVAFVATAALAWGWGGCPPSHPLRACGRCFTDHHQALSAGCGKGKPGGGKKKTNGGCPPSHPLRACGRCFTDHHQALSAGCGKKGKPPGKPGGYNRGCKLACGTEVHSGYHGPDEGPNECNTCRCHNGHLSCTEKLCAYASACPWNPWKPPRCEPPRYCPPAPYGKEHCRKVEQTDAHGCEQCPTYECGGGGWGSWW